ncbi:MAG: CPBP family glutamic-type intramembrane protease [Nitrospira sp.]
MTRPEQAPPIHAIQVPERGAALVLLPIAASVLFYCSPITLRQHQLYQFLPQLCAYAAFLLWIERNKSVVQRLGLRFKLVPQGFRWGLVTGLLLGTINSLVILYLVPPLGGEYRFLADTPHAKIPLWIMLPWFIGIIALTVELNFRGFLLGRLLALKLSPSIAVMTSALLFAFDPFLVATFQQLHWIAVWDGLVWATLWVTFRNLYITIVAHAVEVMVLYGVMRTVLA